MHFKEKNLHSPVCKLEWKVNPCHVWRSRTMKLHSGLAVVTVPSIVQLVKHNVGTRQLTPKERPRPRRI